MTNMKPKWVVDKYIFDDSRIPREVFEKLGIEFFEFDYIPFLVEDIKVPYDPNDLVITYSTINAVTHLKNFYGCYYDDLRYNCNVYMSLLDVDDRLFLNHDHMYCTLSNLVGDPEYYYRLMGMDRLFFRPNSGSKEFAGNVWSSNDISREVDVMIKMYNTSLDTMILVSTPKNILDETRFIVGDREIVASSRYQVEGIHKEDLKVKKESTKLVEEVIKTAQWLPDDLFVIDIATTDAGPKIIELNSFSCSGWYAMNPEEVISKVSSIVQGHYIKDNS